MQSRSYENQEGRRIFVTEVVADSVQFLEPKNAQGGQRLTKDPEYRSTPSGVSVATFTLAVNRTFTNAQGEREADFINVVVFRRQAENVNNYLSKGSLAGVDGRIQSRSYENQEGRRIFVTEVVADSVQFL
ncbi:single-stranded DNA-binding protein, partial [Streptococcus pneumoniae]|uniref:single-stranded DNA-binding protein n=1 Tax=Streptococcus pneumoniae TaxID=1313 RepID=UPI001CB77F89